MSFNKPLALMCYICGREYGTKSLGIHLKNCMQKWQVEEEKKPRNQRRPLPAPPAGLDILLSKPNITAADIGDFNSGAFTKYNNESLIKCPNCNRTFTEDALAHHSKACSKANPFKPLPGGQQKMEEYGDNDANSLVPCTYCGRKFASDRLEKHQGVCDKMDKTKLKGTPQKPSGAKDVSAGSGSKLNSSNTSTASSSSFGGSIKQPARPKTLMCFICGREYGTKSLSIHIKACEEKWMIEQSKLPKKDRRPIPQPPQGLLELLENDEITYEDLERYNNKAFNSYNFTALMPCNHCGRTFKPEALEHHAKVCTAEKPFKPLNRGGADSNQQPEESGEQEDLVPCGKCARKFAPDRLDKHQSICKGTGTVPNTAPVTIKKTNAPQKPPPVNEPKQILRPRTLMCYICGREFGTTSLAIHLKSCEQKWNNEQEKLPKKDRRPMPRPPADLQAMLNGELSQNEMEKYNSKAQDTYNTDSLLTCKFCNRTFTESALSHHSKVCTAEKPFKSVNKTIQKEEQPPDVKVPSKGYNLSNIPDESGEGDGELVSCGKCGRNFNSDRIGKHQKVCKGPTELKKREIEPPKTEKPKKKGDPLWKVQHQEFIQSMQYMKKVKAIEESGGDIRQIGPPPKANTDNLVPCPYCGRKFNDQVAERHIPSCKNVINKPKSIAQSAPKTFSQQNAMTSTASKPQTQTQVKGSSNIFATNSKPVQSNTYGSTAQSKLASKKY